MLCNSKNFFMPDLEFMRKRHFPKSAWDGFPAFVPEIFAVPMNQYR